MKKIIFITLLVFISGVLFAQWNPSKGTDVNKSAIGPAREIGKQDIWSFDPADIEVEGDYVTMYFGLVMEKSQWNDFDYVKEGLKDVAIMIYFNKNDVYDNSFMLAYNSKYDLRLMNYIIVEDDDEDSFLFGGKASQDDAFILEKTEAGTYFCATSIYPDKGWTEWLYGNEGKTYLFHVLELAYGDNLSFIVPAELFQIVNTVFMTYKK